jgi:hypothetical protein
MFVSKKCDSSSGSNVHSTVKGIQNENLENFSPGGSLTAIYTVKTRDEIILVF